MRRYREEHTLVKRQSWGPSNDGGLRMVNWESQSKTPPQSPSPEDGHIYCILRIRITFCHVSENLPDRCLFDDTVNIYFCFYIKTVREVVTVLLIFAKYLVNWESLSKTPPQSPENGHIYRIFTYSYCILSRV